MLSDEYIQIQKKLLTDLGNRLGNEVQFSNDFLGRVKDREIERKWMNAVSRTCNYSAFQIKNILNSIEDYRHLPEEQLSLYVGKIAIQSFLEIINSFEQITNLFIAENHKLKLLLEERIAQKLTILEESWKTEPRGKSKDLKKSLTSQLKNKIYEMAFIRDTLLKNKIIDKTDHQTLSFAWDIRNSMHLNFTAIKDVDFKYPDLKTGFVYRFNFKKGQELYHPNDLISFYVITEQVIFILLKILQKHKDS